MDMPEAAPYIILFLVSLVLAYGAGWRAALQHVDADKLEDVAVDETLAALTPDTLAGIDTHLQTGKKIAAIKHLRSEKAMGLRKAKLVVERRARNLGL